MRRLIKRKKWKRVVDNKMRAWGDIDEERRVIRVNKTKNPKRKYNNSKKGEILSTIYHEEVHKNHPKMKEKIVRRKSSRAKVRSLPKKYKRRLYSFYS